MRRVAAISAGPRSARPRGRRAFSLFCLSFDTGGGPGEVAGGVVLPFGRQGGLPQRKINPSFTGYSHLPGWRTIAASWENFMHFSPRGTLAAAVALGATIIAGHALAQDGVSADTIV